MTVQEVTELVKKKAEGQGPLGKTVKFQFEEGLVHLDGSGDSNIITNEDKDADATLKVTLEDFTNLLNGDLNPMMAFTSGKVKVDGEISVAMKLQKLF